MRIERMAAVSVATGFLLTFAQIPLSAGEITVHRSHAGQFEFGISGFLHPNKAVIKPADQGINPHRHQGTIKISGLGSGYENLLQKCEGARFRNFNVGVKWPDNHLDVGVCTIFRKNERVGTLTYQGSENNPGRKLYLESHTCEQVSYKLVEGEGNAFTPTSAPPDKAFLGGSYKIEVIETYNCTTK